MDAKRKDALTQVIHEGMRAEIEALRTELRKADRVNRDLRIHLRDRDAHIRNLEAMLTPHLLNAEIDATQEGLL